MSPSKRKLVARLFCVAAILGFVLCYFTTRKSSNSQNDRLVNFQKSSNPSKSSNLNANLEVVTNLNSFIHFISAIGQKDSSCEQTYWALAKLNLGKQSWWLKTKNIDDLLDFARDPKAPLCARMALLELYIARLSKEDLEKSSNDLQAFFSGKDIPDQLMARLTQLLAERGVPPMNLISVILSDNSRGQAARCHAWYAAKLTKSYSSDFIKSAVEDAQSNQGPSTKMALEFLADLPQEAKTEVSEKHVKELLFELGRLARDLPEDAEMNQVSISITAINIAPKFANDSEVIPFLRDIIMNAKNYNVKISGLDALIQFPTKSISQEIQFISDNLVTVFPDESERQRAIARLNKTRL